MNIFRRFWSFVLGTLLLVLAGQCCRADGTGSVVSPSGKPVPGATVYIVSDIGSSSMTTSVKTDSLGRFPIHLGSAASQYSSICMIDAKGFAPSGGYLSEGGANVFTLVESASISGTAVDSSGRAIAGVSVFAMSASSPTAPIGVQGPERFSYYDLEPLKARFSAITDFKGNYTISNVPNGWIVDVRLHDKRYVDQVGMNSQGSDVVSPIVVKPGSEIMGRVVHTDGTSANGLSVRVFVKTIYGTEDTSTFVTAADGTFDVWGIGPGQSSLAFGQGQTQAPSSPWISPMPVTVTSIAGQVLKVPDLMMSRGVEVSGVVTDEITNKPVPDVVVQLRNGHVTGADSELVTAKTDATGRYVAHVAPGTGSVEINEAPDGYVTTASGKSNFVAVDGTHVVIDPITIKRAVTVACHVVDDAGAPVKGISLQIAKADAADGWVNIPAQTTDQSGNVIFTQLVPSNYTLDPGDGWSVISPQTITAPSTALIKIVVKQNAQTTLQGKVVDQTGAPIASAVITILVIHTISDGGREGIPRTAVTGEDGEFVFVGVPVDTSNVQLSSVTKDGYITGTMGTITSAAIGLEISSTVLNRLGGSISGVVRDASGKPIDGAWVVCAQESATSLPVETDATGGYKLDALGMGNVQIFGAAGANYCFQKVLDSTTPVVTDLVLNQSSSPRPAPGDLSTATAMLYKLQAITPDASQTDMPDQGQRRVICAAVLASVDLSAGISYLESYGAPSDGDIWLMINSRTALDPASAAKVGVPKIELMSAGDDKSDAAVDLGLAVVPYDPKAALTLYGIAQKHINLDQIDDNSVSNVSKLTALALALKRPEGADDFAKLTSSVDELVKDSKPQPGGYSDADWLYTTTVQQVALGSLTDAMTMLATMTDAKRDSATTTIVSELATRDPQGALTAFHSMKNDSDGVDSWNYELAANKVLPIICVTDPNTAIVIARSESSQNKAKALCIVADCLPLPAATALYVEAETDSTDSYGQGYTPARIAEHAWLRDKQVGDKCFAAAYATITGTVTGNLAGSTPSLAEFAFYYCKHDMAYSRLLLEKAFATDVSVAPDYQSDLAVEGDAVAMVAIDVDRANAMALTIKDGRVRFDAALKIAQYVAASQVNRDLIPFSYWIESEEWSPGTPEN